MSPSVQKKKRTSAAGADESEDSEYKVDKIVNRRTRKGQLQYQIKWEGYPDSDNTWEDADQLDIPEMVAAFEKTRDKTEDDDEEEEEEEEEEKDDYDDDYKDEAPTPKKPRGRPSKTPSSAKATPAKSNKDASKENGEKRGPGRPKKSNTPAKKSVQMNDDESDTLSVDHSASGESSARKRGRGRPPKTPTTEKAVSKSPLKAAQSPGKESPTKKTLFKESPAKKSAGPSAKPLKVVGLKLDGKSYQYIVKCEGESEPRKFSSAEAKNKFAELVVDYYEQTAVVSGIKIDPSTA